MDSAIERTTKRAEGIDTISIEFFSNYVNEKLRLSQYYSDINKVINENLSDWDFVMPYRCESDSIVLLTPDSIMIDKEIIPKEWNMVV